MAHHRPLKEIDPLDLPREKIEKYGPEKLNLKELIAAILGSGTSKKSALELADDIVSTVGARNLADASVQSLCEIPGIGQAGATRLVASLEIGKRLLANKETDLILTPHDVWLALRDIRGSKREHVIVFYLDSRNQTIERDTISIGSVDKTVIHPREVFEQAIQHAASHVLLAHNHPTGNPDPSEHDVLITKRLVKAGNILGIELIDHVIVTKHTYLSMREQGLFEIE